MNQFPTPTMQCRECGKPADLHGDYCHPILMFAFALALAGLAFGFVFTILMVAFS